MHRHSFYEYEYATLVSAEDGQCEPAHPIEGHKFLTTYFHKKVYESVDRVES